MILSKTPKNKSIQLRKITLGDVLGIHKIFMLLEKFLYKKLVHIFGKIANRLFNIHREICTDDLTHKMKCLPTIQITLCPD